MIKSAFLLYFYGNFSKNSDLTLAHLCNALYNYHIVNKAHVEGLMKLSILHLERWQIS